MSLQLILVVFTLIGALVNRAFDAIVPSLAGMLMGGNFLYLLLSRKGSVVFSPTYKEIIARTPHLKSRGSLIVKIALVIAVIAFGLATLGAILSRR